jgi:hypothetical protein
LLGQKTCGKVPMNCLVRLWWHRPDPFGVPSPTHLYVRGKSPSGSVHPDVAMVKLVVSAMPTVGVTLNLPPTGPRLTATIVCVGRG